MSSNKAPAAAGGSKSRARRTDNSARRRKLSEAGHGNFTPRTVGRALAVLSQASANWNAPVLTLMAAQERDPFKTLVGCILSLRTKDETTAAAAQRLFEIATTPQAMLELSDAELRRAIYPVGFYRTKTAVIKGICRDLLSRFEGTVPNSIGRLLTLKGVGRKTANLVITQAFGKPGICVDTHVHRISNRWGLVRTDTPDQTEQSLRRVLPRRHWIDYNTILVAFGQTLCRPVSPQCSRCPLATRCPRLGVGLSR